MSFLKYIHIWSTCTGTSVRTCFRQFVVNFQKFQNYVPGAWAGAGAGSGTKIPGAAPKQAGSETLDVSFSNAMLQYYAILCYRQQERYTVL